MGKVALLAIAAFVVTGAYYTLGAQQGMLSSQQRVGEYQREVLARNAAQAGYERSKQQLVETFNNHALEGDYQGGGYTVTTEIVGDEATIRSTGRYVAGGSTTSAEIQARIRRVITPPPIAQEAPAHMKYAVAADGNLTLKGNVDGSIYVAGEDDNKLNADMHTNGDLDISGGAARVEGFGTYVGSDYGGSKTEKTFKPNYNPNNDPPVQRVDVLPIPSIDIDTLKSRVPTVHMTATTLTAEPDYGSAGTREDPFVIYSPGDFSLSSNVTLSGYVLLLVDGNVDLGGSMKAGTTGYEGGDESNIALYASGSVSLKGNIELWGQVYSNGLTLDAGGTPEVYGSITTLGNALLHGTPNIYYRTASPALTRVFQEPDTKFELIAFNEW